ncbi:hypothetical protein F4808DRAFT_454882 [Astrocystis sublimbata]|nr:hypothetical protein F4808DRAFT_454882 [Astrocystis sublimbata]
MSSSGRDDEFLERSGSTAANTRRVKKKRVRNFTDDDRAAHRIFEKSRREAFKEALTNLAGLLPALADTEPQRLSKHIVVDEGIAVIKSQHEQIKSMTERLEAVEKERDEILVELNHWRNGVGIDPRPANTLVNAGAMPESMLHAIPTALQPQPPESAMDVVTEAAPSFIPHPFRSEPNLPPKAIGANVGMQQWESFDPQQIHHPFANHKYRENGPNEVVNAEPPRLSAYQTPHLPNLSPLSVDRGQNGDVFLPSESPQSFDHYMHNAVVPLQSYMPP